MKNRQQLLLHPFVIIALCILLLNDFFWKYQYHNWLTGKFSDFVGLFVLSVFVSAFFYRKPIFIYTLIAVFFVWWKSPLSQPLIDLLNQSLSLSLYRTVDYTDFIAIPVIFATGILKPPAYNFSAANRLTVYLISVICLVAFCSTSIYRKFMIAPDFGKRISYNKSYLSRNDQAKILHKIDSLQFSYKIDSFTTAPLRFYGGSLLIKKKDSLDKNLLVIDPAQKDTVVYFKLNENPYIAIYNFKAEGEIIPQVNISVRENFDKVNIYLESIILDDLQYEEYINKMSKTKKRFRKLVEKELIRKLM